MALPTDNRMFCPKCGNLMLKRMGPRGPFYGCSNFPRCRGVAQCREQRVVVAAVAPVMSKIIGSPEQIAIWDYILNGNGHLIVEAKAGTGKSFTCQIGMWKLLSSYRILYVCFNTAIKDEFKSKAPATADVLTLNGAGYRMVLNSFPKSKTVKDKVDAILTELAPKERENYALVNAVKKLVGLCQGYLSDGTNTQELLEFAARHEVELDAEFQELALQLVPQVLVKSKAMPLTISFADQMWLPIVLNLPSKKYDFIFIDEAQDLNACQHQLVMKMLSPTGRIIMVGDPNQAIYGFRGSDTDSMPNFAKILEATGKEVMRLPLNVSRRCAKSIIREAQRYVPEITALDEAPEGEIVRDDTNTGTYNNGDLVLCRTNAPLSSLAFKLLKEGRKVQIQGRDIGEGLNSLIMRMQADNVTDLIIRLEKWRDEQIAKFAGSRIAQRVEEQATDKVDCIVAFCQNASSVASVMLTIQTIFADVDHTNKNYILLSSIHRAKGLESDTVVWLAPEITCKAEQPWQQVQEDNLRYVATTRAKFCLKLRRRANKVVTLQPAAELATADAA